MLGHKAVPFLVFWENSLMFSTVAAPVCIPINTVLGFPFLHILSNTCLLICLCWPFWLVWGGISMWFCFVLIYFVLSYLLLWLWYFSFPLIKTMVMKLGPPNHLLKTLNLITSAKSLCQVRNTFTGSGDWDVDSLSRGHHSVYHREEAWEMGRRSRV